MVTDPADTILGEPESPTVSGSKEVKDSIDLLASDDSSEARDEMLELAKKNGVSVSPNMTSEQIQDSVHDVL